MGAWSTESKAESAGEGMSREGWSHGTLGLISQGRKFKFYSRQKSKSTENPSRGETHFIFISWKMALQMIPGEQAQKQGAHLESREGVRARGWCPGL